MATTQSNAALLAHIDTTLGRVTVELQYGTAPQNVSNFILLSQGQRERINFLTGAVTRDPLYVGENFFRTADNSFAKFAQTGSGTGSNTGNTGYTLKDEFDPAVRHTGYTLSMANSGPNTNAGQVFLTGNIAIPSYDDVHTIIGLIPDTASRAVIDAIIAAGDDGCSITAVTLQRTDSAAQAFDETAQDLPDVSAFRAKLSVNAGGPVNLAPSSPLTPTQKLSTYRSDDLANWVNLDAVFVGVDSTPLNVVTIDTAISQRAFYHLALVDYPESVAPASLANRTLVIDAPAAGGIITLAWDATGNGGTCNYTGNDSTGTITSSDHTPEGYGATMIVQTTNLIPLLIKLGYDAEISSELSGRHTLSGWNGLQWSSFGAGDFTLSK